MKIITIFNYPDDENYNKLCLWWLNQTKKYAGDIPIHVWHEKDLPKSLVVPGVIYTKKQKRSLPFHFPPDIDKKARHNIGFKLYNLCQEKDPFIFIDADAIPFHSFDALVKASKDKPFICVDHQQVPKHSALVPFKFLNSGVQVVGDPTFLDFDKLMVSFMEDGGFAAPGTDQAILFSYCKKQEYNYTHQNVGFAWNSCAGYTVIDKDGNPVCEGLEYKHPVHINHYWHEFKPWLMDCPLWSKI